MAHKKTRACIKPDGDGCDGDHLPEPAPPEAHSIPIRVDPTLGSNEWRLEPSRPSDMNSMSNDSKSVSSETPEQARDRMAEEYLENECYAMDGDGPHRDTFKAGFNKALEWARKGGRGE